ncbi:hypothetical protein J5N97_017248 [Dioscorea zingiberensis]|uniref:Uncharacterized protein n=1 Tax=Dioscorea zingiberensis TaxID=325984 RepID=A0A9D5CKW5_9LILI|nr:hypothetical protein J5N97_017248 [Dioscorea zingiberensis]
MKSSPMRSPRSEWILGYQLPPLRTRSEKSERRRIVAGPLRGLDGAQPLPEDIVALETAAEANHPDAVAAAHPPFGLDVVELVLEGAASGCVTEQVQGHARGLYVLRRELQVLLELIDDGAALGVDTEVLERLLEVRDVRSSLGIEELAPEEEQELLRSWQED